jgi:hypothetical protein
LILKHTLLHLAMVHCLIVSAWLSLIRVLIVGHLCRCHTCTMSYVAMCRCRSHVLGPMCRCRLNYIYIYIIFVYIHIYIYIYLYVIYIYIYEDILMTTDYLHNPVRATTVTSSCLSTTMLHRFVNLIVKWC